MRLCIIVLLLFQFDFILTFTTKSSKHKSQHASKRVHDRQRRDVPSLGGPSIKDPKDPQYISLAEESMRHYLQTNGEKEVHELTSIESVTVQVVAGTRTDIHFKISPVNNKEKIKECHSEIWEKSWINFKEIKVNCTSLDRKKRQSAMVGRPIEKDVTDKKYSLLAEESMNQYLKTSNLEMHEVISIEKVTVQIVSGTKTVIFFKIAPITGQKSNVKKCQAEIWEQPWIDFKEIKVNCDTSSRKKRAQPGGLEEKDPNDPIYKSLAEESMQQFLTTSGNTNENHQVISVDKVTVQGVAGTITRISFKIAPIGGQESSIRNCESEIWEKPWMNFKEIKVNCEVNKRSKRQSRPGAPRDVDPKDPKFKALAEESMKQYLTTTGNTIEKHQVISVDKVTVQVVAGSLTRISFKIAPIGGEESRIRNCESEVWEKPWMNFKEIKVNCELNKRSKRGQRGKILGGQSVVDPKDPRYKTLAEESMKQFIATNSGSIKENHEVISVDKVTVQVVAGSLTRISFKIAPIGGQENSIKNCESEIWEKPWMNFKEIKVSCEFVNN